MDTANTTVTFSRQSYPTGPVGVSLTWPMTHRLEVSPMVTLEDGASYALYVNCVSAAGVRRSFNYSFAFQQSAGGGGSGTCPDVVTDLTVAAGQPPIDFDTVTLDVEWTAVPCAGGYNIFAKDDRNNSAWVFLKNEPTDYEYGVISSSVTLTPGFDLYQADGIQTPFAGIDVTLAAVPVNAVDPNVDSGHGQIVVSDQVAPSIADAYQIGGGLNNTGSPTVVELDASFSEYVNISTPDPTIEIQEAGGDPAFALNPADGIWTWDSGRRSGKFRFTLLPGENASGDQFRIRVTDLADFSGNLTPGQSASAWATIRSVGDSFDFEDSPQGWAVNGVGWEWGMPIQGPSAAHSGTFCFGTDLDAYTQYGWDSSLTSPPIRVPLTAPTLDFWYWSYFGYNQFCDVLVNGQQLLRFSYTATSWTFRQIPLDAFAGQLVTVVFRFDSVNGQSYSHEGIFVDDVAISGMP